MPTDSPSAPQAVSRAATLEWVGGADGVVRMIDQTRLPQEVVFLECRDAETVRQAIDRLAVRGAPAIGVAGAMGLVLGVRSITASDRASFLAGVNRIAAFLASSRPTGADLFAALERLRRFAAEMPWTSPAEAERALLAEALRIRDDCARRCQAIGQAGLPLIQPGAGVLTYCNAGALATVEFGTALAPMYAAHERGVAFRVYAPETRPLLQGSRLTAWELKRAGIDVTVLCDGMVGSLMQAGRVNLVITGADRIAANGDAANKIGTYGVAVLARHHGIPFYVAAPETTFDLTLADGKGIPIEERSADEIRRGFGRLTAPEGVPCYSPAFDVTPAELISGLITDRGIIAPVTASRIRTALG